MRLEQSFEVAAPLEQVWHTLIDVEHVAPCLPGAAVTGRNDDGSYNGTFTVKIGPTTASYTGRLEMENVDETSHTATMQAQGTDKRGQGGAKATILSRLAPADGQGTRVEVVTDYHITGRLARFGRGGMIEDISARLLREFAKRLQTSLDTQPAAAPAEADASRAETVVSESSAPAATPEPSAPPATPEPSAPAATPEPEPPVATPGLVPPAPAWARTEEPEPAAPADEAPALAEEPPAPAGEPPAAAEEPAAPPPEPEPVLAASAEPAMAAAPAHEPPPPHEPPPVAPPPPPPPPLDNPPMPSEPMQGLSLVGSVMWGRVKRNPAPAAAAGVAVVLLLARRRRRRSRH